jgi:hypothetical protein
MKAQIAADARLGRALDQAFPVDSSAAGNWADVLSAASAVKRPRRRLGTAVALATAAVLILGLPALAAINGWWFFGPGTPTATGPVVQVASATEGSDVWVLNAYSSDHGICTVLTRTTPSPAPIAAEGCDPDVHARGLSYVQTGASPPFVFGAVSPNVTRVTASLTNGQTVSVETIHSDSFDQYLFYVAKLPSGTSATVLNAFDESGRQVAQIHTLEQRP